MTTNTPDILDGLLTQEDAARQLQKLGLELTETTGFEPDYRKLLLALDLLFASGYGTAALAGFLGQPQPQLAGRRPCDLVHEPEGVDRVRGLVAELVSRRGRIVARELVPA